MNNNTPGNNTPHQLIVDFPPQPRALNRSSRKARSVRFSNLSSMAIYEVRGDGESTFYSSENRRGFKIDMIRSAQRIAQMIASPAPIDADDLIECVGIEKILTVDRAMRVAQHKRDHAQLIISSQGKCSVEELSRKSQGSSQTTRKAAQKLASSYMNILAF